MAKAKKDGPRRKDGVWDPLKDNKADKNAAAVQPKTPQTESRSYRLAYADDEFLSREELRPVRLQLELMKAEMALVERGIKSTVVLFGVRASRLPARAPGPPATKPSGTISKRLPFITRRRANSRPSAAGIRQATIIRSMLW